MSKLLSALAHSDAQRAPATLPSGAAFRSEPARKAANPWLFPALGFALPVAGVLGYLALQQSEVNTVPKRQAPVELASATQAPVIPEVVSSNRLETDNPLEAAPQLLDASLPGEKAVSTAANYVYPRGIEPLDYPQLYTEPLPSQSGPGFRVSQSQPLPARLTVNKEPNGWDSEVMPVAQPVTTSPQTADEVWDLEALDYSELSPQLATQLRAAIAATGDGETLPQLLQEERLPSMPEPQAPLSAVTIGELPSSVQDRIPHLNFQTHIYSSAADSRWVKVNGSEAYEGDEIAPGVVLRRIEPREVVFDFESYLISMPALSEW